MDLDIIKSYNSISSPVYNNYPYATIKLLEYIFSDPKKNRLLITSDKANLTKSSLNSNPNCISMGYHDNCWSTTVNYNAIIEYMNLNRGDTKILDNNPSLSTLILLSEKTNTTLS